MVDVSIGKNVSDVHPGKITLEEALQNIREGNSKKHVEKIRELKAELPTTEDAWKDAKRESIYTIFQGTFSYRNRDGIIQHSGLATIDSDHVENPAWYRDYIFENFDFIVAAWISPSSDGVKAIARIPEVKDDTEYKTYYEALIAALGSDSTDEANKDISRICFESYDPGIREREFDETSVFEERIQIPVGEPENSAETDNNPPVSPGSENFFLTVPAKFFDAEQNNTKDSTLLKMAKWSGVLIQKGVLNEDQATGFLLTEIKKVGAKDLGHAKQTIKNGITYGKKSQPKNENPTEVDLLQELAGCKADPNEEVQPPDVAVKVIDGENLIDMFTLDDFTVITGKSKSGKTLIEAAIAAAALKGGKAMDKFIGALPEGKQRIAHFDTEQSKYDFQWVMKRVFKMADADVDMKSRIDFFRLRSKSTEKRSQLIEAYIKNTPELGLVMIDGTRDIINDINSQTEATWLMSWLMRLSEEYHIHIITVLHQNPSLNSEKIRGHAGSESMAKASAVIAVNKDPNSDNRTVEALLTRRAPFKKFNFKYDTDTHLPVLTDARETNNKKVTPPQVTYDDHKVLVGKIFSNGVTYNMTDLTSHAHSILNLQDYDIGRDRVRDFILHWESNGLIKNNGGKTRKEYLKT